jgi:hypothetical protein
MDFSAMLVDPSGSQMLALSLFCLTFGVVCVGWPAKVRTDAAKLGWWRLPRFPSAAAHDRFIRVCGLALLSLAAFSVFVALARGAGL